MADWYVSSVAYAAIPVWAATTAYSVGQIRRALTTPAQYAQHVYRCTTAGTSGSTEPTWTSLAPGNNQTITDGTAVWTNISGQSAYGWGAAMGTLYTAACGASTTYCRTSPGDRIFIASDHSELVTNTPYGYIYGGAVSGINPGLVQVLSVNRAGSVPPVTADLQSGAAVAVSLSNAVMWFMAQCDVFMQGISFSVAATSGGSQCQILFNNAGGNARSFYLKNCSLNNLWNGNMAWAIGSNGQAKVILDNTPIQFANVGQSISAGSGAFELIWINTPNAFQGTVPNALFNMNGGWNPPLTVTCRGIDLSAVTTTLVYGSNSQSAAPVKVLLDSCKIAPNVTRLTPGTGGLVGDEIELINCYDGSNVINERNVFAGKVSSDRTIYLTSGGQDDIGNYSLRMVSNSRADKLTMPLDCFTFDVENISIGVSKTATVELIGPSSLNNDEINLSLEYMGSASSSIASFASSLPPVLDIPSALPTSGAAWTVNASVTWNPTDCSAGSTLSNGNLTYTAPGSNTGGRATFGFSAGKIYYEAPTTTTNGYVGFARDTTAFNSTGLAAMIAPSSGWIQVNGSSVLNIGGMGNVGVAIDLTANLIWFRSLPSGNWNGNATYNPATGVGGLSISAIVGGPLYPMVSAMLGGNTVTANFGASAFSGTAPAGFISPNAAMASVKQQLSTTFTPQRAGRIRGLVRLGKSATVWVNPQLVIA